MDLWNEYEGRSIEGLFPLERLIRPEGRSAFFSTTNSGTSTVIRLIESHFDEEEILARWTGVADLHHSNLLTLTRFGQATMDETSLVYVVLEPTETDLGQILRERPLTLAETREIATSLVPALQALHRRGFIHEHIHAANIFAVGEVIKLRSDCIREVPEGIQGEAMRSRDVRDLATLLLQCLTQQRSQTVDAVQSTLPAPFQEIVDRGISGAWGLTQMAVALDSGGRSTAGIAAVERLAPAPVVPQLQRGPAPVERARVRQAATDTSQTERSLRKAGADLAFPKPVDAGPRFPLPRGGGNSSRWLTLLILIVLGVMLSAAYTVVHRHRASAASAAPLQRPDANDRSSPATAAFPSVATASPVPALGQRSATLKQPGARAEGTDDSWRVVAFTYNRQDQAAAKARTLEKRFAALHPAVFAPAGHAPFLVTLGGPLSRESAFLLRDKLRRSGLPRDLYAQNYPSKAR